MPEPISGLLRVKPDNTPSVGDTLSLSAEEAKSKKGNDYIKFKRDTAEYGGSECQVLEVKSAGDPDQHGNLSFWVTVDELEVGKNGNGSAAAPSNRDADIAFAGTFNAAVALTAQGVTPTAETLNIVRGWMRLLAPIRGAEVSADPKAEAEEAAEAKTETDASDLPF